MGKKLSSDFSLIFFDSFSSFISDCKSRKCKEPVASQAMIKLCKYKSLFNLTSWSLSLNENNSVLEDVQKATESIESILELSNLQSTILP
ncbi:hypothetical protein BpHYR1_010092 [Brachionus plicatilis]|uniref:Uncharacterized protein n=1 Tax=Brachionus plicatilis TaxID=10195 RepID=A0A3M7QSR5_BRAPC|nr:hypothetical protein BpHYR1_010092 [Brachionus plicatilis]